MKAKPATQMDINISDIVMLLTRLAQTLAEEADLLAEMKVSEIAPLQKEKNLLINALEKYKAILANNPDALRQVDDDEREELVKVIQIFDLVVNENYRRLLTAREVNQTVVEAITEVVNENSRNRVYDKEGSTDAGRVLSVTLDKRI